MKRLKFTDQIRGAIGASGLSRYRIAKEVGCAESSLSRFMSGESAISLRYLDKIADLIGLDVHAAPSRRRQTGDK